MRKLLKRDEGFTLIELMVVVLIIGILVAIALPTFLGARGRAQDKAAQSDLRNGLAAAKVWFTDDDAYTGFTFSEGDDIEPSLNWVDTAATGPTTDQVMVPVVTATDVLLTRHSDSGTFFCIADSVTAGTTYGGEAAYADVDTVAECNDPDW